MWSFLALLKLVSKQSNENNKMLASNLLMDWKKIPEKIMEDSFKKYCVIEALNGMENDTVNKNRH